MQLELFRGKCRSCSSPVSYFALRCPHCGGPNQPNPVVTIAALAGALVTGAVVVGSAFLLDSLRTAAGAGAPDRRPRADARLPRRPPAMTAANTAGLFKRCPDAMSKPSENADALHFLIVPVAPPDRHSGLVARPDRRYRQLGQALELRRRAHRAAQPRARDLSRPLIFAVKIRRRDGLQMEAGGRRGRPQCNRVRLR